MLLSIDSTLSSFTPVLGTIGSGFLRDVSRGASQKCVIESFRDMIVIIATNQASTLLKDRKKTDEDRHAESGEE
jgi:hypothetical protein